MTEMDRYFVLPFLVGLSASLILYCFQYYRQRVATRLALRGEINLLLAQCKDYRAYLGNSTHEWLKEGTALNSSPYFSASALKVYSSMLPNLHFLSDADTLGVIAFYSHYESCESLIEILFARIRQLEVAAKPLTQEQVGLIKKRTQRIHDALSDAIEQTGGGFITKLEDLPESFKLAGAAS